MNELDPACPRTTVVVAAQPCMLSLQTSQVAAAVAVAAAAAAAAAALLFEITQCDNGTAINTHLPPLVN